MNRFVFLVLGFAVSLVALTTAGQAQNYPTKTIRIVVPYPAGGPTDLVGRTVADALTKALKKTVVVENKAGAGGTIGSDSVAKSAPDGHTLLLGLMGPMSIAPKISPNLPYDPLKDLAPIRLVSLMPEVLVARPKLGLSTLAEVVAYGKAIRASSPSHRPATAAFRTWRRSFSSARPASTRCMCPIAGLLRPSTICSAGRSI